MLEWLKKIDGVILGWHQKVVDFVWHELGRNQFWLARRVRDFCILFLIAGVAGAWIYEKNQDLEIFFYLFVSAVMYFVQLSVFIISEEREEHEAKKRSAKRQELEGFQLFRLLFFLLFFVFLCVSVYSPKGFVFYISLYWQSLAGVLYFCACEIPPGSRKQKLKEKITAFFAPKLALGLKMKPAPT